jgi:hypothetical protein
MSTTCDVCCLKSVLHEEKRRTGSDNGQTNATKTVSDVFRHRSRTRKSYCRTRSDVGSERVKLKKKLDSLRSTNFKLSRKTKGNLLYNCDILRSVIFVRGDHFYYSPQA